MNVEIPYPFYDAFTVGLAARLAKYYRPELRALLKQDAREAYGTAANQDQDSGVPIMISPGLHALVILADVRRRVWHVRLTDSRSRLASKSPLRRGSRTEFERGNGGIVR